jgi:hypothetical protein
MHDDEDDPFRPWSKAEVPPGPYFHGTRFRVRPGDPFDLAVPQSVDQANEWGLVSDPDQGGDGRRMFWATTDAEAAMQWAFQRGRLRLEPQGYDRLYVWEVELNDPEVDFNYHPVRREGVPVTSVMAASGRFVRLHAEMGAADYPEAGPGWPA